MGNLNKKNKTKNAAATSTIIMQKRWQWIGHVIRRETHSVSLTALHWTLEGRYKNTWRHTVETERGLEHSCCSIQKMTMVRQLWRYLVAALCTSGSRRAASYIVQLLLTGKFKVAAFSSAGPFDRDVGIRCVYHPERFFYLFATFGWSFLLNLYGNSILVPR